MAPNQKKADHQRPKRNWLLACFGIPSRTASSKKPSCNNSGGRKRRLFKLCIPKIRVIIIRRKKVSFDSKTGATNSQSMIMVQEATKVNQLRLTHASIAHEPSVQHIGTNNYRNLQSPRNQLEIATCRKEEPTPTVKSRSFRSNVTKDSLAGVSIMVVTLVIMSIWGRLCAILCMSAWLYCVPILKVYKNARPNLDIMKIDLASKFYKKKVESLLEGILQGDRKIGIGVSKYH